MKTLVLLTLSFLLVGQSFAQSEENRPVASFEKLNVSSALKVHLTQGNSEELTVKASDDRIGRIKTEVKNGTLYIYEDDKGKYKAKNKGNDTPAIFLSFTSLKSIAVSGAAQILGTNQFNFEDLDLHTSGASKLEMEIKAQNLACTSNGASVVSLEGQAVGLEVKGSGATSFSAAKLQAENVSIQASGAASIKANAASKLKADASGAASIRYTGSPQDVDKEASGAGSVRKM